MNLPELNSRILKVIDYKTQGNINAFAKLINVSQQKLDRLFRIDPRTDKIPSVPSEILVNITEFCVDINSEWLLSGHEEMLKTKSKQNVMVNTLHEKTKGKENVMFKNHDKNHDVLIENEKYKKGNGISILNLSHLPEYYKEINSQNITILTKDIKELSAENALLKKENEELRAEITKLKEKNTELEAFRGQSGENKETLSNAG